MAKKKHQPKKRSFFQMWFWVSNLFLLCAVVTISGYFLTNHMQPTYPGQKDQDEYTPRFLNTNVLGSTVDTSVVFSGNRKNKEIALTFDADMTPGMQHMLQSGSVASFYDKSLIDILENTHTKATLFLTGLWIENYPKEAKKLGKNKLFELANHSYSHGGFTTSCFSLTPTPDSSDKEEIMKTQTLLKKVAGVTAKYFRFPGGCYDAYDLSMLSQLHITPVQWDSVGHDGFNNNLLDIENNILSSAQNGSIIVLHMNGYPNEPQTAKAVAFLIPELKKRGFTFVKVSELLNP